MTIRSKDIEERLNVAKEQAELYNAREELFGQKPTDYPQTDVVSDDATATLTWSIYCLPSCNWFSRRVYTASPPAIGSHAEYIPPPLLRLVLRVAYSAARIGTLYTDMVAY
eukprot:1190450-Prorocentrum_minimum.AAC.2